MTNQTTQNGLTPSLFDVSIPGSPTPKINAAIDNRSLGDFNLTLGDLMTKVIERKESRLHGEYELKFNITHTQNFSDTDLLKRIYDAESYSRYYSIGTPLLVPFQTQTSGYRTYTNSSGEVKIDTSIPFSISQPVATIVLFSILVLLILLSPLIIIFGPNYGIFNWIPMILLTGIFGRTFYKTIKNRNHDLRIIAKARQAVEDKWLDLDHDMEAFKEKLNSDDVFFLLHLIEELKVQKKVHSDEKEKIEARLRRAVYKPRDEVNEEVLAIKHQLDNIYKLKSELRPEEYEEKKENLRALSREKKSALTEFEPLEKAILIELKKFESILGCMDKTIDELNKQRTSLMDKAQLASAINISLGTKAIDWDYIRKSRYHRELTECLNKLQGLSESLIHINLAANQAIAQLPPAWQPKALAAA